MKLLQIASTGAMSSSFEQLAGTEPVGDAAVVATRLGAALGLWRGAPFGPFRDAPFAQPVAARLEELHRAVWVGWAEASLELGRHEPLVAELRLGVAAEPFDERRWALWMTALYRCGRQADALAAFSQARAVLAGELGLSPGAELTGLYARILRQDPDLDVRRASVTARRVPARPNRPLGRDVEIANAKALLARHRCVCVLGLGGIGKTTLAHAVVASLGDDGVCAELGAATRGDQVASIVAAAVGLNPDGSEQTLLTRVIAALNARPCIVLLDNCEHVAEAAAAVASALMRGSPSCRILATSRTALPIAGAMPIVLGPLPIGSASEPGAAPLLVADHAGLVSTDVAAQWDLLVETCSRAGGIPLALELAGRAMRHERGGALVASRAPGHDPVSSAVADALGTLPSDIAENVRRLAQLPDGFTIDFAGVLLGSEDRSIRYQLDGVGTRGLVAPDHRDGVLRLKMPEPVRLHLLASWDRNATRQATRRLVDTVTRLATAAHPRWTEPFAYPHATLVDREHRNVDAVLRDLADSPHTRAALASRLVPVLRYCGRVSSAGQVSERVLTDRDELDEHMVGHLLLAAAVASSEFVHRAKNVANLELACVIGARTGDRDLELRASAELALGRMVSGDIAGAVTLVDRLEAQLDATSHPWSVSGVRCLRALLGAGRGRVRESVEELERLAARHRATEPDFSMSLLYIAAELTRLAGDTAATTKLLEIAGGFELTPFTAHTHARIAFEWAELTAELGRPNADIELRRAIVLLDQYGDHRMALVCRRDLGRWLVAHGDTDQGVALLRQVIAPLTSMDRLAGAVALATLARSLPSNHRNCRGRLAALAVHHGASGSGLLLGQADRDELNAVTALASAPADAPVTVEELLGCPGCA